VRKDVAMTGEVTLRGRVLPIGGLKEKILGAKRAGIRHIIYPAKNSSDMKEIAGHLKKSLTFHSVEDLDQVLETALVGGIKALEKAGGKSPKRPRRQREGSEATAHA
jgi:ATP-dependent Lon protease